MNPIRLLLAGPRVMNLIGLFHRRSLCNELDWNVVMRMVGLYYR